MTLLFLNLLIHFNTSYVSVREKALFSDVILAMSFQYIICFGSRIKDPLPMFVDINFNTSYVSVRDNLLYDLLNKLQNFNTSYVSARDYKIVWRGRQS